VRPLQQTKPTKKPAYMAGGLALLLFFDCSEPVLLKYPTKTNRVGETLPGFLFFFKNFKNKKVGSP